MNAPAIIPDGFVYVIRDDASNLAKIGYSKDPGERLRKLQTGSSSRLCLSCVLPGSLATEAAIHQVFRERRAHGEWFDDTDGAVSEAVRDVANLEFERLIALLRASENAQSEPGTREYETITRLDVLPFIEALEMASYFVPSVRGRKLKSTKTLGFYVPVSDLIQDLDALRAARDFLAMKAGHVQAEADKLSALIAHLEFSA